MNLDPHASNNHSHPTIYIKKADGSLEPFDEEKLVESLAMVGADPELIEKIIVKVNSEIKDGDTTEQIYKHAFDILRANTANHIAVKYSLRRAITELGPNGFPFEKFVAEVLKTEGYETLTDQVVYGGCVPHEIDVVAWNNEKLIMVEAKFHNEFGFKSDVKVALYVKARFDDLRRSVYHFGGKERTLTEGWLITNTKFTDQAIRYGECVGLKMIGWNYPKYGNLQDLIQQSKLHPFTCLTTLTSHQKRRLLDMGIVLCKDISQKPHILRELGLNEAESERVMNEIKEYCA